MTDDIEQIIRGLTPNASYPFVQTREEEELRTGSKPIRQRGGRLPSLYREEVDAIRNDQRPAYAIAEQWKISIETVNRVKGNGRFRNVEYVPRDEFDRRLAYQDGDVTLEGNIKQQVIEQDTGRVGRPFKSGRPALTEAEKKAIALDHRHSGIIAGQYGVSTGYVNKMRKEYGTAIVRRGPIGIFTVEQIRQDTRPLNEVALTYRLPQEVIRSIRDGTFRG